jgi:hypothetical protein
LPLDCLIPMQSQLDRTVLLNKLFDIERGIGTVDSVTLRNLVIDQKIAFCRRNVRRPKQFNAVHLSCGYFILRPILI